MPKLIEGLTTLARDIVGFKAQLQPGKSTTAVAGIELSRQLADESAESRNHRIIYDGQTIVQLWQLGPRRWLGDHFDHEPEEGLLQSTLNRDQTVVADNLADQTKFPVEPAFAPVEENDPPQYFVSTRAVETLLNRWQFERQVKELDPNLPGVLDGFELDQVAGARPLSREQASRLRRLAEPWTDPVDGSTHEDPLLDKPLVIVNDRARAEIITRVFKKKWAQAKGINISVENEFDANLYGHGTVWGEFDLTDYRFVLSRHHPLNVLPDIDQSMMQDFHHFAIRQLMPLRKAIHRWPDKEAQLREAKEKGHLDAYDRWGHYNRESGANIRYQRNMVSIITHWIRDEPLPLSPREAVESKRARPVPGQPGVYEVMGGPHDGAVTTPEEDNWPTRPGIRVIQYLDQTDELLLDEPNRYTDIPVCWNINLPVPNLPWGLGESVRLKPLADALNMSFTAFTNLLMHYAYPSEIWPRNLHDEMMEGGTEPHHHPGAKILINDPDWLEWFGKGGKIQGFAVQPPDIPNTTQQVWDEMRDEYDRIAGSVDVRRGIPPGADISGEAIKDLLQQAGGPVQLKQRYTEMGFEHLFKVLADAMIRFMPAEEWAKYASDYTPAALLRLFEGFKTMRYDVSVTVGSARDLARRADEERAAEDLGVNAISMQTYRRRRGIQDPEGEDRQIAVEQRAQALAQSPTRQAMADATVTGAA